MNKPYKEQYRFLDSIAQQPHPEIRAEISKWIKWAQQEGDGELAAHLQLTRIKNSIIAGNREANTEQALQSVWAYAKKHRYPFAEAKAIHLLGLNYELQQKHAHAIEKFYAAYRLYKDFTTEEFPDKTQLLYALGGGYYVYGDYDNAIVYYREALSSPAPYSKITNSLLNALGMCYRHLKQYDSAELMFRNLYNRAQGTGDTAWIGIAAGNIGITYYLQREYDSATLLLEKDISLSLATNQVKNAVGSMYYLSAIHYDRGRYDAAEHLVEKALSLAERKSFWPNYPLAEQLFTLSYRVFAAKGDMRRAYLYADSAIMAKDSVAARYNALNLSKAMDKAEVAEQKLEEEQLKNQKLRQLYIRNALIACILLMSIIGVLLINRQRLRQKQLQAEKKNAEYDLALAVKELGTIKEHAHEKDTIIEQYSAELNKIKHAAITETDEEVLTQLEQSIILTDEHWENFKHLFEKVHKGFFAKLRMKLPDLTQAEIRFLALTKLNLSSKEMAAMLGVSSNAIRIYRHRLRKKLGLDKEDMLEELVNNL